MDIFNPSILIMLVFVGLGVLSRNLAVTYAMLFLLVVRITPPLNQLFPWIEKYGLTVGIIILTIGVMSPMASGKITAQQMLTSFLGWKSLLAIGVGVMVSWLGGRGVVLMGAHPQLVAGLLVGTVLGVALFKGVPVGPLIAAGILSLMVGRQ